MDAPGSIGGSRGTRRQVQAESEGGDVKQVKAAIERFARESDGQDLLEYGLLACLIAVVVAAGVTAVGNAIFNVFWSSIGQAI